MKGGYGPARISAPMSGESEALPLIGRWIVQVPFAIFRCLFLNGVACSLMFVFGSCFMNCELRILLSWVLCFPLTCLAAESQADRLTYLQGTELFYPDGGFPVLSTPAWVGEKGVDAVVVLAIDDMRTAEKYENYLRPILERLKKIDGRAPVSIMSNALNPEEPQFVSWLEEGLSIEVHTLNHPCPLLAQNNFQSAWDNFHGCVDLLSHIPGNRPVAYRMPCCDSMNSPSPRFYYEIFSGTNGIGQYLELDSSIMNIFTEADAGIPREWVRDEDGESRFLKYLPFPSFKTTIDNYPYPFVLAGLCWEFPGTVPSDWEAQNLHGVNNDKTVEDWNRALDITVRKQGVFNMIFHPHGWIRNDQVVDFIDDAWERYGRRVKFLNFREAMERMNEHLLGGQPLRDTRGRDNGVRLLDVNDDGHLDVIVANRERQRTRLWDPSAKTWKTMEFPVVLVNSDESSHKRLHGAWGILEKNGYPTFLYRSQENQGAWSFDGKNWVAREEFLNGLFIRGQPILTDREGMDNGVRLRDVNRDGICELLVGNGRQNAVFAWNGEARQWEEAGFGLPQGTYFVDEQGRDAGLRFVDLDRDGFEDVVFSNQDRYSVHLYTSRAIDRLAWEKGWSQEIKSGTRPEEEEVPPIVRGGEHPNNGAWFKSGHLWIQNENTADLPDKVARVSFEELLAYSTPAPLTPEESLEAMEPVEGFTIEPVAAEPLTMDPVAFEWGADGTLWVVEMGDYPAGVDGQGKRGGIVRRLYDDNGDGRYDRSEVFLEQLNFPTGIMPWRDGVLISAAPELLFAEDRDGDGRAERVIKLMEGFKQGNQQHRVNGFVMGLDNWVHAANGDSGGSIRVRHALHPDTHARFFEPLVPSIRRGVDEKPVDLRGYDFRFQPDAGLLELTAGQTQYGRHRDDWGNWFGNNNPNWLWHYHRPVRYLVRNPHLEISSTRNMLADYENATRVFRISKPMQRFNWPGMIDTLTSANSAVPYRDTLFGEEFATSVFISEPANNLVHREVLEPDGTTFTSHRAATERRREFLASRDNWFRPTMLKTGPDGALYVADMYRLVIEHIEYGLPGMENRIDLRAGADKGRIWRVYPEQAKPRPIPNLRKAGPEEWVKSLESPNGWVRDTAQRLLVEQSPASVKSSLARLFKAAAEPRARLQALSALHGLGAVTPRLLETSFEDENDYVRKWGIRFAEPWIAGAEPGSSVDMQALLKHLTADPSARVRQQLAFSLGFSNDPRAGQMLLELVKHPECNGEIALAVHSSALPHLNVLLPGILQLPALNANQEEVLLQWIHFAVMERKLDLVQRVLQTITKENSQLRELFRWRAAAALRKDLARIRSSPSTIMTRMEDQLNLVSERARKSIGGESMEEDLVPAAIPLLGHEVSQRQTDLALLEKFLRPGTPHSWTEAAVERLLQLEGDGVANLLISHAGSLAPGLRLRVINGLVENRPWTAKFVSAVAERRIPAAQVPLSNRAQLMKHPDPDVRRRSRQLFGAIETNRKALIQEYEIVQRLEPNPAQGEELFEAQCASCHKVDETGCAVGPDLASVASKSMPALLTAILDPNRAVEPTFASYDVTLKDGSHITGILVQEGRNTLTLRAANGIERRVRRDEIRTFQASQLSLMPEGFENLLTPQQMADLLGFIRRKAAG